MNWESRPVTYSLAFLGLVKGIGNVIIKPFVLEEVERSHKVQSAAMHYFNSDGLER